MNNTFQATITIGRAVKINQWYIKNKSDASKSLNHLPVKVLWNIKKNCKILQTLTENYTEMRNEFKESLKKKYFEDETKADRKTENGQEILQIKPQYIAQYQLEVSEMNQKINELTSQEEQVTFTAIDMDQIISNLDDNDNSLDLEDLEILSLFDPKYK